MPSDLNTVLADGLYSHVAFYNGIAIQEIGGRSGTDTTTGAATAQRTWRLRNTTNPHIARSALIDGPVLINVYDGLYLESLSYERGPSANSWDFTAHYNALVPEVGGYTVEIDTTGGTIIQTSSYSQTAYPRAGFSPAPDFLKSIDVQDSKPQGVQRIIPALKINVRAKIATEYISSIMGYSKTIADLTGTVNLNAEFDGAFAAGELLFAGATGTVVAEDPQMTFIFLASKNVTGLSIGGITGIAKSGHDYLWFLFDHIKDASTGVLVSRPRAAYVDRVYGEADWSDLKIGVAPT